MERRLKELLLLVILFVSLPSLYAARKGIYGVDNINDISDVSNPRLRRFADATAIMVSSKKLFQIYDQVVINGMSYKNKYNLCPGTRFEQQISIGDCSGFLIAPDLLVTAGHCVARANSCSGSSWIFGYYADKEGKSPEVVSDKNIYNCKKILEAKFDPFVNRNDHALIQLDRPVIGVEPLKFRSEGWIEDDVKLVTIGNHNGLPTKIAFDGNILDNSNDYWFSTNLDVFGGSSGSPVINYDTGVVEGLVVRGYYDFGDDHDRNCRYVRKYSMSLDDENMYGEHVTRIRNIQYLKKLLPVR